jgi:hypothetical protein
MNISRLLNIIINGVRSHKKYIFAIPITLALNGCSGIGLLISSVVTSPKILLYATHTNYERNLNVNLTIDKKQIKIDSTINCIKGDTYFGGMITGSWEERWRIELVDNQFTHEGKFYELNLGNFDPKHKIYYRYKYIRNWCNGFLKDQAAIKKANNDNALVLNQDQNNKGFVNSSMISVYGGKRLNKSFLYLTVKEGESEDRVADNLIINDFNISKTK